MQMVQKIQNLDDLKVQEGKVSMAREVMVEEVSVNIVIKVEKSKKRMKI